ncbi:MAG: sensor histidine kinase [Terriglobia bacterium]
MTLNSPIFRKFFWSAFIPALLALIFLSIFHSMGYRLWLAALIFAFAVALLAAWVGSRALIRRINQTKIFAENLVHSQLPVTIPLPAAEDELAALARSLRRAAGQWQGLLDQLKLESARREAILKSMVEGVLAVDDDLRVIFCNESFASLVGAGLPLPARLPLLDLARDPGLSGMLAQVLSTHEPLKQTLQLAAADGRVFEVQAAPLAEPARTGAIAILHDITGIERLERVRKDFVANVSHELRTPLTAIRGYAETLLDGGLEDAEQNRKFLEVILNHAIRLNNIASDLLVLSELESGRSQPEQDPVSVRVVVDSALRAVEVEADSRQVHLVRGLVEEVDVLGSRVRLEQAIINLLNNAVKFNRPGGHARIEATCSAEASVYITVSDNGIGIPSEDLSRIFERFYRVDKARSSEVGGTGLGLSIVKHVVERMGGGVKVESQLGKGASFTLMIPACKKLPAA